MDADGSRQRNLTRSLMDDDDPIWLTNRDLLFHTLRDGNWELYHADADGLRLHNLTRNHAMDGRSLYSF